MSISTQQSLRSLTNLSSLILLLLHSSHTIYVSGNFFAITLHNPEMLNTSTSFSATASNPSSSSTHGHLIHLLFIFIRTSTSLQLSLPLLGNLCSMVPCFYYYHVSIFKVLLYFRFAALPTPIPTPSLLRLVENISHKVRSS